jgi:uncharacterized protein YecE (DUF72 family)
MAGLHIGTSGWNYPEWQEGFYALVPRGRWLEHYAQHFDAVEVNASFYRSLRAATLARWHDATPAAFRFAIKGHRQVTHIRRLQNIEDSVARQQRELAPLGDKAAVVLWQLPANLPQDLARLEAFAGLLARWTSVRHVLEFREPSWFTDEVAACLSTHRLASAISDAATWPRWDALTTDLAYLRLHGRPRTYASTYGAAELGPWAARVATWLGEGRAAHVYFDNTMQGAAPEDAARLRALLGGREG